MGASERVLRQFLIFSWLSDMKTNVVAIKIRGFIVFWVPSISPSTFIHQCLLSEFQISLPFLCSLPCFSFNTRGSFTQNFIDSGSSWVWVSLRPKCNRRLEVRDIEAIMVSFLTLFYISSDFYKPRYYFLSIIFYLSQVFSCMIHLILAIN